MSQFEGSVYIAVIGSDLEYVECRDSIDVLQTRPDDQMRFIRATKGYEARQMALDEFMESSHAFILFLDADQVFPVDTVERMRSHKLPYVSGYYMRRRTNPIYPIWYEFDAENSLPSMRVWTKEPERGRLVKLGASGWGCLLLHREVVEAVRPLLKGEQEILEDDMDVWPYDLGKVLKGEEAIRPLRGSKDMIIGSDVRFPFFARQAGYVLWGDPDVRCGHIVHYPLGPDDYCNAVPAELKAQMGEKAKEIQGIDLGNIQTALEQLK